MGAEAARRADGAEWADRPIVIIPAYKPTSRLIDLVQDLARGSDQRVVVVDDGSGPEYAAMFERLQTFRQVECLKHATNLGKGQALKTALNHLLVLYGRNSVGAVTADADGQHLVSDIRRVSDELVAHPNELILGSRVFDASVPWKSRIGNRLTQQVFRGFLGRSLRDTQTGLRGIPVGMIRDLLKVRASGYEFELEMLVLAMQRGIPLRELPITTVYEDQNRGSHFDPVRDSLRIYFVFFRFLALSLTTAALDFLVFWGAYSASQNILLSTAIARVAAGSFNFYLARLLVFRSTGVASVEAVKYVLLVVWLMLLSYGLLTSLVIVLEFPVYTAKLFSEVTLFAASFALQRLVVFRRSKVSEGQAEATDWDSYYRRPAKPAAITRRITARLLERLMTRYGPSTPAAICEFGGANSCFYEGMRARYPSTAYVVVDNNAYGLQLLRERAPAGATLIIHERDLCSVTEALTEADVVFSVGLIEHFRPADTAAVIRAHFAQVNDGGLVIITFPTPTWLYRVTRAAAERLGVWRFPDERPLGFDEVLAEVSKHGAVLTTTTNWAIVLTQGVVVARKAS